jgi:tellurium resistance protein TerD
MLQLAKGGNLQLSKVTADKNLSVGLSWDKNTDSTVKDEIDIDVFGIIVDSNDKGVDDGLVRFYNNIDGSGKTSEKHYAGMTKDQVFAEAKKLAENSVIVITKDNRDGQGDGDDETLFVNSSLLMEGKKVIIAMNIYEAKERKQLFGMVKNAKARVYDASGTELFVMDMGEDFSLETGVIVGEFYLSNSEAKFKNLSVGFEGTINDLISKYK